MNKTCILKTLFNIVEAPFFCIFLIFYLMSVLYDDVQMDQFTARNTKVLTFMQSLSRSLCLLIMWA